MGRRPVAGRRLGASWVTLSLTATATLVTLPWLGTMGLGAADGLLRRAGPVARDPGRAGGGGGRSAARDSRLDSRVVALGREKRKVKDDLAALFLLTLAACIVVLATRGSEALQDIVQNTAQGGSAVWAQRPSWKQIVRHPSLYLAAVVTVTMLVGWWSTALVR